jgi:hypothetical protein
MKALIRMMAILLPLLVFSQDTLSVSTEAREVATEIIKGKKSIDSMKLLKSQEVKKQLKLISLINQEIEQLKACKKIKSSKNYILLPASDTVALKPDSEAVYWEEIPRKWTGRLFHASDTKVRIFRYVGGQKVYAN